MIPALAGLLIAGAVFNLVTWPAFLRRVVKDPRARDAAGRPSRFLAVHLVLFGIAMVLAAAFVVAAIAALGGAW